jgi:hypothetical protein
VLILTSVAVIATPDFSLCTSLTQIKCATNGQLWTIRSFQNLGAIGRVMILASVCSVTGFDDWPALAGELQELARQNRCASLIRRFVPASVEALGGFNDCDMSVEIKFESSNCG